MHDSVVTAIGEILAREHDGKKLVELQREDPVKAARVRHQGMQEGLMILSPELAKSVLKAESPEADTALIDVQIARLSSGETEEPDEIAIADAEEAAKLAEAELTQAVDDLRKFPEKLKAAKEKVEAAQAAKDLADRVYDERKDDLREAISRSDDRIAALQAKDAPAGLKPAELTAFENRTQDKINAEQATKKSYEDELKQLILDKTNKELDLGKAQQVERDLKSLDDAKNEVTEKRKAKKEADEKLERLQNPTAEVNEDHVEALNRWKAAGETDSYEKVIEARFSQKRGDEFTRDKLASLSMTADGQLEGAELLRKHIFAATDEGKAWFADPKNQELARRMLSDEAIARSIIETFRIDTSRGEINAGGNTYTYEALLAQTANLRSAYEAADAKLHEEKGKASPDATEVANLTAALDAARKVLQAHEQPLLQSLLPQLENATQFQVGDLMRFMVHEGVRSAARGDGFLKVPDYYAQPEPELREPAMDIMGEGMGKVEFKMEPGVRPQITWEGPVHNLTGKIYGSNELIKGADFTFRVVEQFERERVNAKVQVKVNKEFLQYLPREAQKGMPAEVRGNFYDDSGRVRTELTQISDRTLKDLQIPEWITVSASHLVDENDDLKLIDKTDTDRLHTKRSYDMLSALESAYSPEISYRVAVQTANELMDMPPAERLRVIRGLPDFIVPFTVAETGEAVEQRIRVDNDGNLWIAYPDGSEEMELGAYFARRERNFRGDKQALTTSERRTLRRELDTIQQYIGVEILEHQRDK